MEIDIDRVGERKREWEVERRGRLVTRCLHRASG